jgi:DNA polymerase III delta prime subunit
VLEEKFINVNEDHLEELKRRMQMLEYIGFTLNFVEEDTSLTKSAIKAFRKSFESFNIRYIGNGEYVKDIICGDEVASYVIYKAHLTSKW